MMLSNEQKIAFDHSRFSLFKWDNLQRVRSYPWKSFFLPKIFLKSFSWIELDKDLLRPTQLVRVLKVSTAHFVKIRLSNWRFKHDFWSEKSIIKFEQLVVLNQETAIFVIFYRKPFSAIKSFHTNVNHCNQLFRYHFRLWRFSSTKADRWMQQSNLFWFKFILCLLLCSARRT